MKLLVKISALFLIIALLLASCRKEAVCATCKTNTPPVAIAGQDTLLILPADSLLLDGSASTDKESNVQYYTWTKIAGPDRYSIANMQAAKTMVRYLEEGLYRFELNVTDAFGLSAKDTVQVMVQAAPSLCEEGVRPTIQAHLVPIGVLSEKREGMAVAAVGNTVLFAGGYANGSYTSTVDIYDAGSNTWSTTKLSNARGYMTPVTLGNKIFFAGGIDNSQGASSRVDIYDLQSRSWSTTELSQGRWMMAGAAAGNKVLFAGGFNWGNIAGDAYPTIVDIYDVKTMKWITLPLSNRASDASVGIAATAAGNKIYLAGASGDWPGWDFGDYSATINIYDAVANTWSSDKLREPKGFMAAVTRNNNIYWAGGKSIYQPSDPIQYYQHIEVKDVHTNGISYTCLFQPNAGFFTRFDAVQTDSKIVFFTGAGLAKTKFDIYDITSNKWSIGLLPHPMEHASLIAVNNKIYIAGAYVNGVLSSQVYQLII